MSDPLLSPRMAHLLASSDGELLRRQSPEAQEARRGLLRGATVALVGLGPPAKRFIYERIAELGVRLVLIDDPGHWGEELVTGGIAERFVHGDLYEGFESQFDSLRETLTALDIAFDGVFTYWEESVPVAARLAQALGVPGMSPEAADKARSKRLTLVATHAAGIPSPRFAPIPRVGSVDQTPEWLSFPAVVKPEYGSSAMGVYRVNSDEELHDALTRVEPALLPLNPDGNFTAYGDDFLIEEYLDGTEFDIDLLFSEGRPVYATVTENWPTLEPFFFETGLNCPSLHLEDALQALIDIAIRGVRSLGIETGAVHVEAKDTSTGPRLLEINARMGGGSVRDNNLEVYGVDLVEEHLLASVGIPINPMKAEAPRTAAAGLTLYSPRTGTLQSFEFAKAFHDDERVFFVGEHILAGDHVQSVEDGFPTELLEFVLRERDVPTAIREIKKLAASVSIPVA
jgi:biotin carboxylase